MLCTATLAVSATGRFVRVEGENLVRADGSRLYITGTNLGNWLNPEGYMFGFSKTNSGWMIDIMLRQMVGPDETAAFWKAFKDSYITRDDIRFIASTGANTVRLPFNYKLSPMRTIWGFPRLRTVLPESTALSHGAGITVFI